MIEGTFYDQFALALGREVGDEIGYNGRDDVRPSRAVTRPDGYPYGHVHVQTVLRTDGIASDAVVEHRCTNEQTGVHFTAFVCKRCLDQGRETRVTCRTFIPLVSAAVPSPENHWANWSTTRG